MMPRVHHPPLVYLDMNIWIALARGLRAGAGPWFDLGHELRAASEAGRVVVPLCSEHYRELWLRGSEESRVRVGRLMQEVSDFQSLSPIHVIREAEIDAYVARWFWGESRGVRADEVLGRGVSHAFASPHGRLRFVESLASREDAEGPPVPRRRAWTLSSGRPSGSGSASWGLKSSSTLEE